MIGLNMEFKKRENHFAFKLLIIIILFGVVQLILIPNYMNVPKISDNHSYIFGTQNIYPVHASFSWAISFNDNKISHIENIIIWVFTLWGFMKCIDLMFFLEKYK